MPSPQSLVTFVTVLFLALLGTRVQLAMAPVWSAVASFVVAIVLGGLVALKTRDEDEDDITAQARNADGAE